MVENKINENTSETEYKKPSIHTLESDLASAVSDKNYGNNIIKIITDPNKKIDTTTDFDKPERKLGDFFTKKNIFIISLIIFILISVSVIYYILYQAKNISEGKTKPNKDVTVETPVSTSTDAAPVLNKGSNILNPEIIQSLDFTKTDRAGIVFEIDNIKKILSGKQISSNNIIEINTNLTILQLFEKIKYSGDEALIRSFGDVYAFGVYSKDNYQFDNYLLIKIDNFDLAFKYILSWEKYMPVDLKDIFVGNNEIPNPEKTEVSSTTPKKYYKTDTKVFLDRILKNYDIREFVDNKNNTNIIYGFINNKFLLITSGESSFIDIKNRLLKENIQR